jgi:hypothetical protein
MSTPELLKDLHITVQCLQKELAGSDGEKVKVAQEAYLELLAGFYEEYQDMAARQQYEAAKDDPDYFLMLIKLALYHEGHEKAGKQGEPSVLYFNWKLFTQI